MLLKEAASKPTSFGGSPILRHTHMMPLRLDRFPVGQGEARQHMLKLRGPWLHLDCTGGEVGVGLRSL